MLDSLPGLVATSGLLSNLTRLQRRVRGGFSPLFPFKYLFCANIQALRHRQNDSIVPLLIGNTVALVKWIEMRFFSEKDL
jgi:hypothetical protein